MVRRVHRRIKSNESVLILRIETSSIDLLKLRNKEISDQLDGPFHIVDLVLPQNKMKCRVVCR